MNAKAIGVVFYFIINFKSCQGANYTNYGLYSVTPETKDQLKYLRSLDTQKYMDVVFWEKPYRVGQTIQLVVSPVDHAMFQERAEHFNLDYTLLSTNVQDAFDRQSIMSYKSLRPESFSFQNYHPLGDIYQWLTDLSNDKNASLRHFSIGMSAQGRDLSAVNINLNPGTRKTKVIIEGGIHGCEWPSVVFVTYFINELAMAQSSEDEEWIKIARKFDWYIIPVLNPDGYSFTHKEDRLWRKNRNKNSSVDLNRNFDQSFGKFATTSDPASDVYCGPKPFSEPETKALQTFLWPMRNDIKYYFSIHSYGQRIIIPYEDRIPHLDNFGEMENYSRQAIRKAFLLNKVKFSTGTLYDIMGIRMSGTSASWAKKELGVKYAYTIQVRDTGTYGFALPCDQLLPMCTETKVIIQELMTAKPRYVRALFADDASANALYIPFIFLSFVVTLK